jgi:hypothetical protein
MHGNYGELRIVADPAFRVVNKKKKARFPAPSCLVIKSGKPDLMSFGFGRMGLRNRLSQISSHPVIASEAKQSRRRFRQKPLRFCLLQRGFWIASSLCSSQ